VENEASEGNAVNPASEALRAIEENEENVENEASEGSAVNGATQVC
jgi:hypothetical protein